MVLNDAPPESDMVYILIDCRVLILIRGWDKSVVLCALRIDKHFNILPWPYIAGGGTSGSCPLRNSQSKVFYVNF